MRDFPSAKRDHMESIPVSRDGIPSFSDQQVLGGLACAQQTLVRQAREGNSRDWWRRVTLDDALRNADRKWSKRARHAAFDRIRQNAASGWVYKAAGKRSAYILEDFQTEPTLPVEFRASPEDLVKADRMRARAGVLRIVEMAIEDYRSQASRGPANVPGGKQRFLENLWRTVEPYVDTVDSMVAQAAVPLPMSRDSPFPVPLRWHVWRMSQLKSDNSWAELYSEVMLEGIEDREEWRIQHEREQRDKFPALAYRWFLEVREHFKAMV